MPWVRRAIVALRNHHDHLEEREVIDVLPPADRPAKAIGQWLAQHRGIEIVSRDRRGLYAEGVRRTATA